MGRQLVGKSCEGKKWIIARYTGEIIMEWWTTTWKPHHVMGFLFILEILEVHDFYYFCLPWNLHLRRSVLEGGSFQSTSYREIDFPRRGTGWAVPSLPISCSLAGLGVILAEVHRDRFSSSPPPDPTLEGRKGRQQGKAVYFRGTCRQNQQACGYPEYVPQAGSL